MKNLCIVLMVIVATLVAASPSFASGPRLNPRFHSRAFSRELGRQRAQATSLGIRSHGPSVRVFSNGTRVFIVR